MILADNGDSHKHDHGNHKHNHGDCSGHDHNHSHDHAHDHKHDHKHDVEKAVSSDDDSRQGESLAMKAALAHVIGDIVQSIGVIFASLLIWLQPFDIGVTHDGISQWNYADPFCTILFAGLVIYTTKDTMNGILRSLMFTTPKRLSPLKVENSLLRIPNVVGCHDIHIWEVGRNPVFTAHVIVDLQENSTEALHACLICMNTEFGIDHCTIQMEIHGQFDHGLESYGQLHDHTGCCH